MNQWELKNKILATNYFEDNKYLDKYCKLIEDNKDTKREKYKTQIHHIIPKCYFIINNIEIDNGKENKINLLYKDHILAHYYLVLSCNNTIIFKKLNTAFIKMTFRKCPNIEKFDFTQLESYQELYKNYCTNLSESKKGTKVSEETRQKMSKPKSESTKLLMSLSRKGKPNPKSGAARKGIPHPGTSEKTKGKFRPNYARKKGKKVPIIQKYYNIYCLELDEMFESTFDIRQKYPDYNVYKIANILKSNSGNLHFCSYKKMHWCYGFDTKEESKNYLLAQINFFNKNKHNTEKVQNLNTGEVYDSMIEIELKYSGKPTSNIGRALKNNRKAYGYYWVRLKDHNNIPYIEKERQEILTTIKYKPNKNGKPVQNLETGEIFESAAIANIKFAGKNTANIAIACCATAKKENCIAYGYHWIRLKDKSEGYSEEERKNIIKSLQFLNKEEISE